MYYTPENRMGSITPVRQADWDPELQMFRYKSNLDSNRLLEVRARARHNPKQDGYYGRPTGEYIPLVYSWLNITRADRLANHELFKQTEAELRLKEIQNRTELLINS